MSEAGHHHHGGHGGGHAMHAPGGDGASIAQIFGLDGGGLDGGSHGTHHNFLTHLLGLDHDAHGHGGGEHGAHGEMAQHMPSHSAGWNSALQSVKLSDALQGINVTPNFLFILMFFGFICWLFVIYWVRHHEPLANGVLGTAAAHSATEAADRRILAGTKYAFPNRTCEAMGDIYVPMPAGARPLSDAPSTLSSMPLPTPPLPPMPSPDPKPMPLSYAGLPAPGIYAASFGQPQAGAYMVPEQHASGARMKMIVNR
jgi:hypothetical protein